MIFDKILNAFNMDNWEKNKNNQLQRNQHSQNASISFDEKQLLISIRSFWQTSTCDYYHRFYREPSFQEIQEFAKVDILSCFTKARTINNFSYSRLHQLGITNWHKYFSILLQDGYVRRANCLEILNSYTLADLKILADSFGLKKSGKKADLAQRICDSLSPDEGKDISCEEELFILTEKGREFLSYQEDYILLRRGRQKYDVSLSEFNDYRMPNGYEQRDFYDTIFQILCDRIFYYQCNKDYAILSVEHLRVFELLIDEQEHTHRNVPLDIALSHYIEYLYLLSCLPSTARYVTEGLCLHNIKSPTLPNPHVYIYKLRTYKDYINYASIFANNPPSFFMPNEFIQYINDLFDSPIFDNEKWNQLLQNRLYNYSKLN